MGLETEILSLYEARAYVKRIRQAKRKISNEFIHQEILHRDSAVEKKKSRKQRQKEEQSYKSNSTQKNFSDIKEIEKTTDDFANEIADVEVWDFDEF